VIGRRLPAPPFLLPGLLALGGGLWAGLLRLPLDLPTPHAALAGAHGPLMAGAFLGTVISVERAAALGGRPSHWLAPLLHGLGGLALLAGPLWLPASQTFLLAAWLLAGGAAGLLALSLAVWRRQPVFFNQVMALGAGAQLLAHLLLAGTGSVVAATPGWIGFLVLTITGERLELNRLLRPSPAAQRLIRLLLLLLVVALGLSGWHLEAGTRLLGLSLAGVAVWLARNDLARRTVRLGGLARYTGLCLLSGYGWLAVSGLLMLAGPFQGAGPWRDASLHSLFLGFVFAMIFGHAPIIVPALTGLAVRLNRGFHAALALLHGGLLLRVAGDLAGQPAWRAHGGELGAASILLFLGVLLASLRRPV